MSALILLLIILLPVLYYFLTRSHNYWKNRGVPYFKPIPIFGNLRKLFFLQQSPGQRLGELYRSPEAKGHRYYGMFIWNSEPSLLIRDPELVKQILVKDFAHFSNRNIECFSDKDPLGFHNLFVLRGKKWKYLRSKLTPTFTSGKLKQMFCLIKDVADELKIHIDGHLSKGKKQIDVKELMAKYTTDVISTCAFGIKSNSLNDPNAVFRVLGKQIFELSIYRALELRSFFFAHSWARFTGGLLFSKESNNFLRTVFWDTYEKRERDGTNRSDFIDSLIQLKKDAVAKHENAVGEEKDIFQLDGDFMVAQSALFFAAGFETTASSLAHILTELAYAPEIQEKLRQEIKENVKAHENEITYDGLSEMKYLDNVVSEGLRKYPAMPFIDRICTEDYKIPDSDLVVKKNTPVFLALYNGLHYDPKYFPDPEKFDPDRFTPEVKATRHQYAYVPFGEGPHICIGNRFALINIKTGLCSILLKYKVTPTEVKILPIKLSPRSNLSIALHDLPLKFEPLKEH